MLQQTETRVAEPWLSNTVLGDTNTCDIFQDLIQKKTEQGKIREPQQQPAKQSKTCHCKGESTENGHSLTESMQYKGRSDLPGFMLHSGKNPRQQQVKKEKPFKPSKFSQQFETRVGNRYTGTRPSSNRCCYNMQTSSYLEVCKSENALQQHNI